MISIISGAGGFIGSHLAKYLKARGHYVIGVDVKRPEFDESVCDEWITADLRKDPPWFKTSHNGRIWFWALAADMGGMGFIQNNHSRILNNNLRINLNSLMWANAINAERLFFSSSACIYPEYLQQKPDVHGLAESHAYPADPQDAYGWEKLTTEKLLLYAQAEGQMDVRIARFHNVFGELGTWQGGREKAPAALCRKIAEAKLSGNHEVEIWGDGRQTRSFLHVSDCVDGIWQLMNSHYNQPLNIGSDVMVSINDLAYLIADIAGVEITLKHVSGAEGVRGRNSDNTLCEDTLGWRPKLTLRDGLERTYHWIEAQVKQAVTA